MYLTENNNKRIAKNTLLLYFRMLLTIVVSLYTSRVILNVLGIEDFGVFNVVGGVIAILGFLNGSLSAAGSRFITYALGKGDEQELEKIFSSVLFVHFILATIVVFIGETLGLWFVCNKLVIPVGRMTAALWVYHCSILAAVVSIISVPYNSLIIAHERMSAFAYISIIEVILKLLIVWMLIYLPYDKLIIYAIFYLLIQIIVRIIYSRYCTSHFFESRTLPSYSTKHVKEICIYAGWTMNGNLAVIGYTQGLNILLNMFFGPVVNAARGIAVQVEAAVMTFVQNFQLATRPQIIKSYAVSDLQYMHKLVVASSKYGLYLIMIISFPILLCISSILQLWLGVVPDYTVAFVRIMLLAGLLQPLSSAMITAIHATGDIRKFQIFEGTSLLMIVPIAYILLKTCRISPEIVMYVYLFIELLTQCIRVLIVVPRISMSYLYYLKSVILPIILPMLCFVFPLIYIQLPDTLPFLCLLLYILIGCIYMIICVYLLGIKKDERIMIHQYIINVKKKLYK